MLHKNPDLISPESFLLPEQKEDFIANKLYSKRDKLSHSIIPQRHQEH